MFAYYTTTASAEPATAMYGDRRDLFTYEARGHRSQGPCKLFRKPSVLRVYCICAGALFEAPAALGPNRTTENLPMTTH